MEHKPKGNARNRPVLDMDGAVNWDSFNYLGVPIFKSNPKTSAWLPIVEKFKKKIMGWGAV